MKTNIYLLFILAVMSIQAVSCVSTKSDASRAYTYNNKKPGKGYGAYAYLLLPSGYSTTTGPKYARMLHTANAFLDNFLLPKRFTGLKDKSDIMVTHWMLRTTKPVQETGAAILEQYDYTSALSLLTAIKMSGKQGPVLVAWKKPYEELDNSEVKQSLIFDLSKFSDEDIDRAFKLWREMLSEDVDDWNKSKNKLVKFKEEVRNLFQQYGQTLFDLITIIY